MKYRGISAGSVRRVLVAILAVIQFGCAMSPKAFQERRSQMNLYDVCATWIDALESTNWPLEREVSSEAASRGLTLSTCSTWVKEQRQKRWAAIGAVLLVGAVVAAARHGGGGAAAPQSYDSQWDWDLINNSAGFGSIWVCRGVQTGQFSDQQKCAGRLMNDGRWPGLGDPFRR